ncbi:MAG: hypothetical protein GX607_22410 [Myxococcales bacterium]|nr:hypothetical protein [Myxococcales bacterium]
MREERRDTVAVLIPDDDHAQKTPTEPSLIRNRDPSRLLADISSLPPVHYRRPHPFSLWFAIVCFGAALGFLVYVVLADPPPRPAPARGSTPDGVPRTP